MVISESKMAKAKSRIVRKDSEKQKPKQEADKEEKKVRAGKDKEKKREIQEKGQDEEAGHEEIQEEDDEGTKLDEDFGFDEGITSQRKAPVLESETGEKLEGLLEGVGSRAEDEEKKEEIKYSFEKPKYSFSDKESEEMIDRERDISELITRLRKKDVFREAPRILTEKGEDTLSIVTPSEFRGGEFEEYITKYVEPHEKDENISIHEDRKRDIKKYKRVL